MLDNQAFERVERVRIHFIDCQLIKKIVENFF